MQFCGSIELSSIPIKNLISVQQTYLFLEEINFLYRTSFISYTPMYIIYMHLHSRFPSFSTTENVKLKESHTSFKCCDILDSRSLALQWNNLQRNFWTSTKRISEITRLKNRIDLIDKSIRNSWSVDVADSQ